MRWKLLAFGKCTRVAGRLVDESVAIRAKQEAREDRESAGSVRELILAAGPCVVGRVRWTPKVGQAGSLTQSQKNDPHVEEASSAQS
jgi:hypothetical protein